MTNNKKIEDAKLGDRTLATFHCNDWHFSTYTIGSCNLSTKLIIGEYETLWTYIYFGYSNKEREAGVFAKFPDVELTFKFKNI